MVPPLKTNANVVAAAFSSTALISLAPNVLLVLFPSYASGEGEHSPYLSLGQALAAGGLLGDVFLHVIPHAAADGDSTLGLFILLGFFIFFVTDVLIRSLGSGHQHHHGEKKDQNDDAHSPHKRSTVLLNLAADALHNFTDGLAIGASFAHHDATLDSSSSFWTLMRSRGGLATLSIMFHEIPHELGDFAILVKQGFSKRSAIYAQFGTAIAAMVGTGVGLMVHEYAGDRLIFVTGGGFIYLATVTILPDILDETSRSWKFRMALLGAFAIGVGFLYAVSLLEEMDESGHGHSRAHPHLSTVEGAEDLHVRHHGDDDDHHHHYDHHKHHDHHDSYHDHGEL